VPNADILKQKYVNLVLHGVDTIADVYLNEQFIGLTENMFVRYRFDTKPFLRAENNTLRVEITSPTAWAKELHAREDYTVPPECPPTRYNGECHMNMLRKMQASFAWDWGLAAPSMGLWKPVELQVFNSAFIRDVSYGLEETPDAWLLYVQVYLEAGTVGSLIQGVLDVTLM
jgi:beta-mannosidase